MEKKLLDYFDKDHLLKNIFSVMRVLATAEEIQTYDMTDEMSVLFSLYEIIDETLPNPD